MVEDERVQILLDLGLTLLQAKVYLALSKTGKATIKVISTASGIARQDIYRIMPTLERLSLAEKIISNPTMYKATPLKEGFSILLQNKTQEHTELQKKTADLIRNLTERNKETMLQEEMQFAIVSSNALLWKWLNEGANKAQISIDLMSKWESMRDRLLNSFQDFKKALKKGVKIRVITEKHEEDKATERIIQTLKTNPLFEIRYLSPPIPIETAIHDTREVGLNVSMPPNTKGVPSLMSNHPQFAKIITAYFELRWNEATDALKTFPLQGVKMKTHRRKNSTRVEANSKVNQSMKTENVTVSEA